MKVLNNNILHQLYDKAKASPRKRAMKNYHPRPDDPLQRMVNYMLKGSYVQPHKHENPPKREMFVVLKGSLLVVEFDEQGHITDYGVNGPAHKTYGSEVQPGVWHTLIPLSEEVVVFEVKDGPYNPEDDKKFAVWAPAEDDPERFDYNNSIISQLGLSSKKL